MSEGDNVEGSTGDRAWPVQVGDREGARVVDRLRLGNRAHELFDVVQPEPRVKRVDIGERGGEQQDPSIVGRHW